MNEIYQLLLSMEAVVNNIHETAKANNMFMQSIEKMLLDLNQKIETIQKSLVLEIPKSEPTAAGAEDNDD